MIWKQGICAYILSFQTEVCHLVISRHRAVGDMTDRTAAGNEKTSGRKTGIHERVIFAAPSYEKKESFRHISYNLILLTSVRLIIIPYSLARFQSGRTDQERDQTSSKTVDTCIKESSVL